MNKMKSVLGLGFICLLSAPFLPTYAGPGLKGSAHDFESASWNKNAELCQPCHTPHNGSSAVPLWNHSSSVAVFRMYNNTANTQDSPPAGQPSAVSLACLSCHDGVTALDAFGGAPGTWNMENAPAHYQSSSSLGTDLSNDHPISIQYNASVALADGRLYDPVTAMSGLSGGGTISKDLLYNGKVECSSCHDVHNSNGNSHMLRKENRGSALCLTCHDK